MKKKGFTYIELMIAMSIFTLSIVMIIKLNITSETNINKQMNSQKMMFVAQQQVEKFKTTLSNIGSYEDGFKQDSSGYYIVVRGDNVITNNGNLYLVSVWVRENDTDKLSEIKLQSHVLKN